MALFKDMKNALTSAGNTISNSFPTATGKNRNRPIQVYEPVQPAKPTLANSEFSKSWTTHTPIPHVNSQMNAALGEGRANANLGVMDSMTDGSIYAPYAAGSKEAQARLENNTRAATAGSIHAAGLSGTGAAAGYGNATEAQLAQNRFANNLEIEKARNDMKVQGMNTAFGLADNANRFDADQQYNKLRNNALEQETLQARYANAGQTLGAYYEARRHELNALNIPDMLTIAELKNADPNFVNHMQQYWEASGNSGEVPLSYIKAWHQSASNPQYTNAILQVSQMIDEAFPDMPQEQRESLKFLISVGAVKWDAEKQAWVVDEAVLGEYDNIPIPGTVSDGEIPQEALDQAQQAAAQQAAAAAQKAMQERAAQQSQQQLNNINNIINNAVNNAVNQGLNTTYNGPSYTYTPITVPTIGGGYGRGNAPNVGGAYNTTWV